MSERLTYKALHEHFLRRDEISIDELKQKYPMHSTPTIEDRLLFAEERLKDLTSVTMHLLLKLEAKDKE